MKKTVKLFANKINGVVDNGSVLVRVAKDRKVIISIKKEGGTLKAYVLDRVFSDNSLISLAESVEGFLLKLFKASASKLGRLHYRHADAYLENQLRETEKEEYYVNKRLMFGFKMLA